METRNQRYAITREYLELLMLTSTNAWFCTFDTAYKLLNSAFVSLLLLEIRRDLQPKPQHPIFLYMYINNSSKSRPQKMQTIDLVSTFLFDRRK